MFKTFLRNALGISVLASEIMEISDRTHSIEDQSAMIRETVSKNAVTEESVKLAIKTKLWYELDRSNIPSHCKEAVKAIFESVTR